MKKREWAVNEFWHSDDWIKENIKEADVFDYSKIDSLAKFTGTHPAVMQKRVNKIDWHLDLDPTRKNLSFKKRMLHWFEQKTGIRLFEYKNYTII
jgi:hypothetical protein